MTQKKPEDMTVEELKAELEQLQKQRLIRQISKAKGETSPYANTKEDLSEVLQKRHNLKKFTGQRSYEDLMHSLLSGEFQS